MIDLLSKTTFPSETSLPTSSISSRRFWLGHKVYWFCQLAGWISILAISFYNRFVKMNPRVDDLLNEFLFVSLNILICMVVSHVYRWIILSGGWKNQSLAKLIPKVIGMSLLFGVLLITYSWKVDQKGWMQAQTEGSLFVLVPLATFSLSLLFVMWSSIYFSYHYYTQVQEAKMLQLRMDVSMKEVALASLQAQVNPHFLFNGLNTLRALIDSDPDRARDVVTQLAKLFRASLSSGSAHLIPLSQEIETVEAYLMIEKTRFEDRLQIEADVSTSALRSKLPPFLLQTLVENAVKYGTASCQKTTLIRYEVSLENKKLHIVVKNPGNLNLALDSTKLGLKMARERLELLFGADASLELSHENQNVLARAIIPQPHLSHDSSLDR